MALNSTQRKILAPILALGTALIIINLFQLLAPEAFDPLEQVDAFGYTEWAESCLPQQVYNDLLGTGTGLFAGALFCVLIYPSTRMYIVNLVPLAYLLLISVNGWRFWISKELLWLMLPFWILLSMAGYLSGRFIHNQFQLRKQKAH